MMYYTGGFKQMPPACHFQGWSYSFGQIDAQLGLEPDAKSRCHAPESYYDANAIPQRERTLYMIGYLSMMALMAK